MSKLVALQTTHEIIEDAWVSDFSNLKQKLLLFDQVGIFRLSNFYKQIQEASAPFENINPKIISKANTIISELEWMRKTGIVFEATLEDAFNDQRVTVPAERQKEAEYLFSIIPKLQEALAKEKDIDKRIPLVRQQSSAIIRMMAIAMEITKGITAVSAEPLDNYKWGFQNSSQSEVIQIVINNLPLPSNETPWEQIVDYRSDPENQKNLLDLRRWIRNIATENPSQTEVSDQIEWLLNEFQSRMKLHKMKANTETLEVIIKAPFELIENLIKLRISKIPEPFFVMKKIQISLMEAELNAPGREMAYIIKSKETFQSQE